MRNVLELLLYSPSKKNRRRDRTPLRSQFPPAVIVVPTIGGVSVGWTGKGVVTRRAFKLKSVLHKKGKFCTKNELALESVREIRKGCTCVLRVDDAELNSQPYKKAQILGVRALLNGGFGSALLSLESLDSLDSIDLHNVIRRDLFPARNLYCFS